MASVVQSFKGKLLLKWCLGFGFVCFDAVESGSDVYLSERRFKPEF